MFNFKKSESRKKKNSFPLVIFRMFLSLTMFAVLGVGSYQAFKYFTGTDPLQLDPQTALMTFLSSEKSVDSITKILGFKLPLDKLPLPSQDQSDEVGDESIDSPDQPAPAQVKSNQPGKDAKRLFKFAIISDSHKDLENLKKVLLQSKILGAKFVIGLGDWSEVGTTEELTASQEIFKDKGLPFYLTAGDHDLWDSRDKKFTGNQNFAHVFGSPYQSFSDSNIRFIIVYNSDNYEGVDALQRQWLEDTLNKAKSDQPKQTLVFLHEPLYHPTSDRVMGKGNEVLKSQADDLISLFKESGVGEVFAGDIHAFSRYREPKSGLNMTTVGAVTTERNLQPPRFTTVDIFSDGGYNIEDLEIK